MRPSTSPISRARPRRSTSSMQIIWSRIVINETSDVASAPTQFLITGKDDAIFVNFRHDPSLDTYASKVARSAFLTPSLNVITFSKIENSNSSRVFTPKSETYEYRSRPSFLAFCAVSSCLVHVYVLPTPHLPRIHNTSGSSRCRKREISSFTSFTVIATKLSPVQKLFFNS